MDGLPVLVSGVRRFSSGDESVQSDQQRHHVAAEALHSLQHVGEVVRRYVDDHGGYASPLELSNVFSSFFGGAREQQSTAINVGLSLLVVERAVVREPDRCGVAVKAFCFCE